MNDNRVYQRQIVVILNLVECDQIITALRPKNQLGVVFRICLRRLLSFLLVRDNLFHCLSKDG